VPVADQGNANVDQSGALDWAQAQAPDWLRNDLGLQNGRVVDTTANDIGARFARVGGNLLQTVGNLASAGLIPAPEPLFTPENRLTGQPLQLDQAVGGGVGFEAPSLNQTVGRLAGVNLTPSNPVLSFITGAATNPYNLVNPLGAGTAEEAAAKLADPARFLK